MEGDFEAAGDALTGGLVAGVVENETRNLGARDVATDNKATSPEAAGNLATSHKAASAETAGNLATSHKAASAETAGNLTAGNKAISPETAGNLTTGNKATSAETAGNLATSSKATSAETAGNLATSSKAASAETAGNLATSSKAASTETAGDVAVRDEVAHTAVTRAEAMHDEVAHEDPLGLAVRDESASDEATRNEAAHDVAGHAVAAHRVCLNCGAKLMGAYCAACGQPAHLHRSLLSIGHDILHGVFHFEGKIWRTVPELAFRPGRLTRRYIDGERAKFVSPLALFLFTVFVMFAVFSYTGGVLLGDEAPNVEKGIKNLSADWKRGNQAALDATEDKIKALRTELEEDELTEARRARINEDLAELEAAREVMQALARGDFARIEEINKKEQARKAEAAAPKPPDSKKREFSWPAPGSRLIQRIEQIETNPELVSYKLKTNGYKFSWALIPLSIPFVWLLFFWRRDIRLYDHAVFVTYSITFMMLFLVVLSLLASAGAGAAIWGTALFFVPPIHMYKQLRGAYGLSRFGAWVRLCLLLLAAMTVLMVFVIVLAVLGVLV